MFKKLIASFVALAAILVLAGSAFASTSVRLEQPKSPTNQTSFNLVFVALDTSGGPVTVTCWKQGPSDGSASQFATITLSNGGNTDSCPVDGSILNQQGNYAFYVVANGVQSATVNVTLNTNGPGTPNNYSKDHPSSCEYKISFTTASDNGETSKVELYRSDNTSFSADNGTRVQSMGIGSNTSAVFTDNVPDCSKSYFYAIRAFDSAGNGSGVVGDSEVHTVNPTAAPTQGAIPVNNGSGSNGGTGSSQGNTGSSVLGAQTNTVTGTPAGNTNTETKGVLGTQSKTSPKSSGWNWTAILFSGLGTLLVLGVLVALFRKFKSSR